MRQWIMAAWCGATLLMQSGVHADDPLQLPIADGPFKPTMESLKQYEYPEWFRDAKFGIWAHWGPQSVPMEGDWYARNMYVEGSRQYKYHVEHYGHPSVFGYKDIVPLWKAEKWEPARLMALYKRAGAKYFVSMGTHHDNFFLWNSKLHDWNAVNYGPRRDVVGDWQKAAQAEGLKFGVSEHLGASFTWFQPSHGADKSGEKAGVPYDGADPKNQSLYHFPADANDKSWYSNNPKWQQQWYSEIRELVDNYHPDLLYSDGSVPFNNDVGLSMIAHLYNDSAARNGGKTQAVYNCKQVSDGRWVRDLERSILPKIDPHPWQTDTSIGDWFYNRNWKFRPVSWVIYTLVDNVSKNGNLLLNVVQRPDGSIDPEVEQMLNQLADWNSVHGEAIFGTRPWLVYGETALRVKGGAFSEDFKYTAREIRFTTKDAALYALSLGYPEDRTVTIRSLAKPAGENGNTISDVSLLGYEGKIEWTQTPDALVVKLPEKKVSEITVGLKILGTDLKPIPLPPISVILDADKNGAYLLGAADADLHGAQIRAEEKSKKSNLGYWDNPADYASWTVNVVNPGKYKVTASLATIHSGSPWQVEIGQSLLKSTTTATGAWEKFVTVDLGEVTLDQPGKITVNARPSDAGQWKAMNLESVTLTPVK